MSIAYFKETIRNTLSQPAMIFVMILQAAIVLFIALGLSFEYHNKVLLSVSMFGMEPFEAEGLIAFRSMINNFSVLGWLIFMFLYIIGTAAAFSEMFKDPLLNILLTKKHSRTQIVLSRYAGIVASVVLLQFLFAVLTVAVLFFKTKLLFLWILMPMIVTPAVNFLLLASLSGLLGLVFENATVTMVLSLMMYYCNDLFTAGMSLPQPVLKFIAYLFPPLATINRMFMDIILSQHSNLTFPHTWFLYACCYLGLTLVIFQRRDL
ncbi:MAG: hypothetical protein EHM64_11040 [Ignavibacteriae bacterium]|nr:MAG: hypothetical protein EHM64_11040 [Ignavibacteriota bacterium]